MVSQDKTLICRDCSGSFTFSAGEQDFFIEKGLRNEPKRCPNCRLLVRCQRNGETVDKTSEVNCAECGTPTRVPFKPKGHKPIYCTGCFQVKKREDADPSADELDISVSPMAVLAG